MLTTILLSKVVICVECDCVEEIWLFLIWKDGAEPMIKIWGPECQKKMGSKCNKLYSLEAINETFWNINGQAWEVDSRMLFVYVKIWFLKCRENHTQS